MFEPEDRQQGLTVCLPLKTVGKTLVTLPCGQLELAPRRRVSPEVWVSCWHPSAPCPRSLRASEQTCLVIMSAVFVKPEFFQSAVVCFIVNLSRLNKISPPCAGCVSWMGDRVTTVGGLKNRDWHGLHEEYTEILNAERRPLA